MTTATVAPSFGIEAERLRRLGQRDRAIALCREGLAVYPDHISARVTLGYALMEHGRRIVSSRPCSNERPTTSRPSGDWRPSTRGALRNIWRRMMCRWRMW